MKSPLVPNRLPDGPLLPGAVHRWLTVAVEGLAPASAERVRAEYLAYFDDASNAGEGGLPGRWGDPKRVNKELRRAHLTVAEAKLLPPEYERGWSGFQRALNEDSAFLLSILGSAVYRLWRGDTWSETAIYTLVMWAVILLSLTGRWLLLSRLPTQPIARVVAHWATNFFSVLLLGMVAVFAVVLLVGVVSPTELVSMWQEGPILVLIVGGGVLYKLSVLVRGINAARKIA